jgi:hypothetical protein
MAAGLLGLAAALLAGAWALLQKPAPYYTQRLPDGTMLVVEAVTYGGEHRFSWGNRLQRLLVKAPPGPWERFAGDVISHDTSPNSLVLWLGVPLSAARWRITTRDAEGRRYADVWGSSSWRSGDNTIYPWVVEAFPRREPVVRFRVEARIADGEPDEEWRQLAEFTVANPDPGPHPVWTPEPLPQTRQAGDLAVTLAELVRSEEGETDGTLRITAGGRPASWTARAIEATDATGSRFPLFTPGEDAPGILRLWGSLGSVDEAYRLRVELVRTSGYSAQELWTLRGVELPEPGLNTPSRTLMTPGGVTIEFLGIVTPEVEAPSGKSERRGKTQYAARFSIPPLPEGTHFTFVGASDDQGGSASSWEFPLSPTRGAVADYHFKPRPGAKRVDLTVAVHRNRYVEFLAKPARGNPPGK